jgi:outer membrane receptor protein involved in Fe transport
LEADAAVRVKRVTAGAAYTLLNAVFKSPEEVNGAGNSANAAALAGAKGLESQIHITPGNRIPLIPRHMAKLYADFQVTSKATLDINFVGVSSSYARGNENNLHRPDGTYYLGPGTSPGYGVVNVGARYRIGPKIELFAQIDNLFNREYYTAAQLGPTGSTDQGTFIARPFPPAGGEFPVEHATFYAPGAPFGAWGGLRLRF